MIPILTIFPAFFIPLIFLTIDLFLLIIFSFLILLSSKFLRFLDQVSNSPWILIRYPYASLSSSDLGKHFTFWNFFCKFRICIPQRWLFQLLHFLKLHLLIAGSILPFLLYLYVSIQLLQPFSVLFLPLFFSFSLLFLIIG